VSARPTRLLAGGGRLAVVMAAGSLVLAGCGSSSKSGGTGGYGGSASSSPAPATGAKSATVETHSGDLGTYLTDGSGRTVYLFASDSGGTSSCTAACTQHWPPLTTTGAPAASGGATASMLGTISRSDGSKQVTYAGHPLYYFAKDTSAGDIKGQGNDNFGAKWWVVSPTGQSITTAGTGSSSPLPSPSKSSGGGGGWA
jgi:predicted lipoprotein with Yx(FWY)xxD motif